MNHYQKLATVALRLLAVILAGVGLLSVLYGLMVFPLVMGSNPLATIPLASGGTYVFIFAAGSGWIVSGTIVYAVSASLGRLIGRGM